MNKEDIQIDRFLAGEMEAPELFAFEEQMRADEVLRRKVNLRRELTDYLSSGEEEFVNLLEEVGNTIDKEASPRGKGRRWWLLLAVIPLGLLLWQQLKERADGPTTTVAAKAEAPSTRDTVTNTPMDSGEEKNETPDTTVASPSSLAPAPAPSTPTFKRKAQSPSVKPPMDVEIETLDTLIYASLDPAKFTPNSYLEDIVTTGLRTAENSFSLSLSTEKDTVRLTENPRLSITTKAEMLPEVELFIYNNSPEDFLEEKPVQQIRITSWEESLEEKIAVINLVGIHPAGRYYLLLLNDDGELLAGRRLLIK